MINQSKLPQNKPKLYSNLLLQMLCPPKHWKKDGWCHFKPLEMNCKVHTFADLAEKWNPRTPVKYKISKTELNAFIFWLTTSLWRWALSSSCTFPAFIAGHHGYLKHRKTPKTQNTWSLLTSKPSSTKPICKKQVRLYLSWPPVAMPGCWESHGSITAFWSAGCALWRRLKSTTK